ncbi:hypothetical protein MRB53_042274 [Persea americana]|nr:hypothetical protein MRB53_042274 [Persea americana]
MGAPPARPRRCRSVDSRCIKHKGRPPAPHPPAFVSSPSPVTPPPHPSLTPIVPVSSLTITGATRDRKAEYLKSLEEEVARLRQLDALVNSQRNVLACQNQAFREYFRAQSASVSEPAFDLPQSTGSPESSTALSHTGSAIVSVRFDENLGRERTFLDLSETEDYPYSSRANGFAPRRPQQQQPSPQQSQPLPPDASLQTHLTVPPPQTSHWAALDFILSLEWPCKDHHVYEEISPSFAIPTAQTASTVDPNAPAQPCPDHDRRRAPERMRHGILGGGATPTPPPLSGRHSPTPKSTKLTTPAQAYAYIKRIARTDAQLEACMRALQTSLAGARVVLWLRQRHVDELLSRPGRADHQREWGWTGGGGLDVERVYGRYNAVSLLLVLLVSSSPQQRQGRMHAAASVRLTSSPSVARRGTDGACDRRTRRLRVPSDETDDADGRS